MSNRVKRPPCPQFEQISHAGLPIIAPIIECSSWPRWRPSPGPGARLAPGRCLKLIALATNLFWYGNFSFGSATIASRGPLLVLMIPVLGGLIVGLMARYGSDKIRGHGIPEAIETILFGESKLSLKVALLKPLSSAVSIGSGGPFGAEGPIIMTGGAIGSLFAQLFRLSAAERKTLLVAGATAGMTGIFGTPFAAIMLAVELLLFEWKPRSFVPVVTAVLVALRLAPAPGRRGTAISVRGAHPAGYRADRDLGRDRSRHRPPGRAPLLHPLPDRGRIPPLADPLDVVAGDRRGRRRDRRPVRPSSSRAPAMAASSNLLDGNLVVKAVLLLLVVKAIVWLVALGSGTSGGILAPLLILGGCAGFLIGQYLPGRSRLLGDDRNGRHHERRRCARR